MKWFDEEAVFKKLNIGGWFSFILSKFNVKTYKTDPKYIELSKNILIKEYMDVYMFNKNTNTHMNTPTHMTMCGPFQYKDINFYYTQNNKLLEFADYQLLLFEYCDFYNKIPRLSFKYYIEYYIERWKREGSNKKKLVRDKNITNSSTTRMAKIDVFTQIATILKHTNPNGYFKTKDIFSIRIEFSKKKQYTASDILLHVESCKSGKHDWIQFILKYILKNKITMDLVQEAISTIYKNEWDEFVNIYNKKNQAHVIPSNVLMVQSQLYEKGWNIKDIEANTQNIQLMVKSTQTKVKDNFNIKTIPDINDTSIIDVNDKNFGKSRKEYNKYLSSIKNTHVLDIIENIQPPTGCDLIAQQETRPPLFMYIHWKNKLELLDTYQSDDSLEKQWAYKWMDYWFDINRLTKDTYQLDADPSEKIKYWEAKYQELYMGDDVNLTNEASNWTEYWLEKIKLIKTEYTDINKENNKESKDINKENKVNNKESKDINKENKEINKENKEKKENNKEFEHSCKQIDIYDLHFGENEEEYMEYLQSIKNTHVLDIIENIQPPTGCELIAQQETRPPLFMYILWKNKLELLDTYQSDDSLEKQVAYKWMDYWFDINRLTKDTYQLDADPSEKIKYWEAKYQELYMMDNTDLINDASNWIEYWIEKKTVF